MTTSPQFLSVQPSPDADGSPTLWTAAAVQAHLQLGSVILVDVRERGEFAGERIGGARSLPLSTFDPAAVPLDAPDRAVVIYCQSGRRSQQAAQKLRAAGCDRVIQLEGGLNAWKEAGYGIERDRNAPISIMRQVQIIAGTLILTGTLLGAFVAPGFLALSGFVGAGLFYAGASGNCMMATLLAKLPYNRR
jgi:rhodanese-related sulfurtransferase